MPLIFVLCRIFYIFVPSFRPRQADLVVQNSRVLLFFPPKEIKVIIIYRINLNQIV